MYNRVSTLLFSQGLKSTVFKTLFKSNLNASVIKSYRPISNPPFPGKLIERVVFQQLYTFLSQSILFNTFQPGFQPNCCAETALLKVLIDLNRSSDASSYSFSFARSQCCLWHSWPRYNASDWKTGRDFLVLSSIGSNHTYMIGTTLCQLAIMNLRAEK